MCVGQVSRAILAIALLQNGGPLEMPEVAARQQVALRSLQDILLGVQGAGVADRMGNTPVDSGAVIRTHNLHPCCATCQRRCTGGEGWQTT